MQVIHQNIQRLLIAAQVANLEHADTGINASDKAKAALIAHLTEALKKAKRLV
jgi:hypothetical protein